MFFFFFLNDRVPGSWIMFSSAISERSGSWAAPSVGPVFISGGALQTGGDSQEYQVKKKPMATEGFSCWLSSCVCVWKGCASVDGC